MKFHIQQIKLWLNNSKIRELNFLPNKINVITGNSSTGKSSIIKIIDYCLLVSDTDISPKFIGENVKWYGLDFFINDKHFTIARGAINSPESRGMLYFSDQGIFPEVPEKNINEKELKRIIEKEFSIDTETIFASGSKSIKSGTKISFRYFFWLFCVQTQTILPNDKVLFEKQHISRYKDALQYLKIMDWVIGADSPQNIITQNNIDDLQVKKAKLEKKQELESSQKIKFKEMIGDLYLEAKELEIIQPNLYDDNEIIATFERLIYHNTDFNIDTSPSELDDLFMQKLELQLKLRNLKTFYKSYENFNSLKKSDLDSLMPIDYIKRNFDKVILSKSSKRLIDYLFLEFANLKKQVNSKTSKPSEIDLSEQIKIIEKQIEQLQEQISEHPTQGYKVKSDKEKYMFLGYIKSKLEIYKDEFQSDKYVTQIEDLSGQIDELESKLNNKPEVKQAKLNSLNDYIDKKLEKLQIEDYTDCKAFYNETKKLLDLRESKTGKIYSMPQISSASSCLYLHLAFFFGLHDFLLNIKNPYVPSFLILDQVSTPYYDNVKKEKNLKSDDDVKLSDIGQSDREKLNRALGLLNSFMSEKIKEKKEYQIILIEHIPESLWKEEGFTNYHLVDKEFRNGYKLINNLPKQ